MKKLLPRQLYNPVVSLFRSLVSIQYRGRGRICPVCGASAKAFRPFGNPPREEAQCWRCHSLERHRFLWHYLTTEIESDPHHNQSMLHVAPEACLRAGFQRYFGKHYLTADLFAGDVDIKMDITDIHFPDEEFDAIYCSHVLEHVPDDRRALSEFFRVLKPDGWAILLVPIIATKTFEDASITTPQARLEAFGQEDHVRNYGPDYIERLQEAGFIVEKISPQDRLSPGEITRFGLGKEAGDIFVCRKQ